MGAQSGSWRKSSYSANGGEACVEAASANGTILVRDTTNRTTATLAFTPSAWATFTATLH